MHDAIPSRRLAPLIRTSIVSRWKLPALALVIALLGPQGAWSAFPAHARSAGCPCPLRPGDQLWLLSTHCANDPAAPLNGVSLTCYASPACMEPPQLDALIQTAGGFHNVIVVHGYDYDVRDALQAGCEIYQRLIACPTTLPVRLIVWAWPSDRSGLRMPDVQVKTCRAEVEGRRLGVLLAMFAPSDSVGLVGHSLGALIIASGLHHQSQYSLVASPSGTSYPATVRPRAVLMAAAFDQGALLPGREYGLAVGQAEQMTVLYNPGDPVLRRYDARRGGQSLGRFGSCCPQWLGPSYQQCNVSPEIGWRHLLRFYLNSPSLLRLLQGLVTAPPPVSPLPAPILPSASTAASGTWTNPSPT